MLATQAATPVGYLRDEAGLMAKVGAETPSRPVGLLRCQVDPLQREMDTTLVDVRLAPLPVKKGKKGKSSEAGPALAEATYHVLLADTILFPEGGGQPSDRGTLTIGEHTWDVIDAVRQGLDAVHVLRVPKGEEVYLTKGSTVHLTLDWDRRKDHMDQHTGQHLLSAALEQLPSPIPTLSWALTTYPQACYVELARAPMKEEVGQVQEMIDRYIAANTAVQVTVEAMESVPRPEKLPEDYEGTHSLNGTGVVRTVTLEGVDQNPCCGTHWPSLASLRLIHILPSTSKVRGTNVRLYFAVGERAMQGLITAFNTSTDLSRMLDASRAEAPARLDLLLNRERASRKREARLRDEVAVFIAEAIFASLSNQEGPTYFARRKAALEGKTEIYVYPGQEGVAVHLYRPNGDAELLSAIGKEVSAAYEGGSYPPLLLALQSGSIAPSLPLAQSGASASLILLGLAPPSAPTPEKGKTSSNPGEVLVSHAAEKLRGSSLGQRVKGGGKGRWQGKLVPSGSEVARWDQDDAQVLTYLLKQTVAAE